MEIPTNVLQSLADLEVFSREDFLRLVQEDGTLAQSTRSANRFLCELKGKGRIIEPRRGLFLFLDAEAQGGPSFLAPFTLASKAFTDAVIAREAALALHSGRLQPLTEVFYYSSNSSRSWDFSGIRFRPIQSKNSHRGIRQSRKWVTTIINGPHCIPVTTRERTLVDLLDFREWEFNWKKEWVSLIDLFPMDFELLLECLQELNTSIVSSRIGFLLEQIKDDICVSDEIIRKISIMSSTSSNYFSGRADGISLEKWKLTIPAQLFLIPPMVYTNDNKINKKTINMEIARFNKIIRFGNLNVAESMLEALRNRFLDAPTLFTSSSIKRIKSISAGIDRRRKLQNDFGYSTFLEGQDELIEAAANGKDVLGILPTGAGKSMIYQIAASMRGGLTMVISPFISLIKNQIDGMASLCMRVAALNSMIPNAERQIILTKLLSNELDILYITPETLEWLENNLNIPMSSLGVRLIAVDEAHLVPKWAKHFRPLYGELGKAFSRMGRGKTDSIPVVALTGTATERTRQDIIQYLELDSPYVFISKNYRHNLILKTIKQQSGCLPRKERILSWLQSGQRGKGIIFCQTQAKVERLVTFLRANQIHAEPYHAGLGSSERERVQVEFSSPGLQVVVATSAFGTGINQPDVRWVIQTDLPLSIEDYAQQIGRAGRDRERAECILYYAWPDVGTAESILTRHLGPGDKAEARELRQQVREMYHWAEGTRCRHQSLAEYFGQAIDACGNACDVCLTRSGEESP